MQTRSFLGASLALPLGYALLVRPWMLHWGATWEERRSTLPGDDIVEHPRAGQTRAITIRRPPADVWPWLVQLGQGRGGLYSYDWLENLFGCDIHSVDKIVPELQHLDVGDEVRLVPQDYPVPLHFAVAEVQPERVLVLRGPGDRDQAFRAGLPYPTWALVLADGGDGTTRLVSRWRTDFKPTPTGLLMNKYALEPVSFLMERKMLLGVKSRAERGPRLRRAWSPPCA